jgi:hypothetical protein
LNCKNCSTIDRAENAAVALSHTRILVASNACRAARAHCGVIATAGKSSLSRSGARTREGRSRFRWTTFVLRTSVFALGAARRVHSTTFVLRTPVFALGAARRAHGKTDSPA